MDCSMPGFSVLGIFQEGILEWVAISFLHIPGDLPNPGIEPGSPALVGYKYTEAKEKFFVLIQEVRIPAKSFHYFYLLKYM